MGTGGLKNACALTQPAPVARSFTYVMEYTFRGGYRGGAKGVFAPPPGQGYPAESRKVPQVGHILRRKCPRWGRFYGESAPGGADVVRVICPEYFFAPPPENSCIRP